MGYQIQYSPEMTKKYPPKKKIGKLQVICISILVLCGVAIFVESYKSGTLKEFLIPGDAAVTEAAMEALADDLKNGARLKDAVTTFCLEILEHGTVY